MNFVQKFFAASALILGLSAQAATPSATVNGDNTSVIVTLPDGSTSTISIAEQIAAGIIPICHNGYTANIKCTPCGVTPVLGMINIPDGKGGTCAVDITAITGSKIDNMTYNFIHTVDDIVPAKSGGCGPCGSAAPQASLSDVGFSQILVSRDPGGSLADRKSNLDIHLALFTKTDGSRVIESYNPALLAKRRLSLSGNTFIDSTYQASQGVKLYTGANAVTTDFAAASTAVMILKDGAIVTFEVFLDQDNADPALRSYAARLLSIRDKASHGFTLSYLDAASSSASPLEKRRFSSLTDSKCQSIDFTWTSSLVFGRFAVQSASGLGQSVSYRYQDNKFAGATYADGSESSITWSLTPSGLTKGSFFEPRLPAMDRSKEVFFTSASQAFLDASDADGQQHYNSASMLCLVVAKNNEVTYMTIPDSRVSWHKTLEGGELKEMHDAHVVKYKDWTFNPAATSLNAAFTGSQDKFARKNPWNTRSNGQARPNELQEADGTLVKNYFSADGTIRAKLYSDGSVERFVHDSNKNLSLHQDRSGRIEKFTFDAQNNKTSHSTGWALQRAFEINATAPGLKVSSYATSGNTMPDFSTLAPYAVERSLDFSLPNVMALDGFGCVYEGDLEVASPGEYSFFVKADDGAKLFIDGQEVVATPNWSTEGASIPVTLSAGKHSIKLSFFEIGGAENLSVKWQGPGIAKQVIPASVLSHSVAQEEVEAVATAEAATESWSYFPAGHPNQFMLKSHTDFKGVIDQVLTYDANNRVIKVEEINDAGTGYIAKQTITHDASGIASITDSNGRTTAFYRDQLGRLVKTTFYDGSTEETFFANTGAEAGLVVKTKARDGSTVRFEQDSNGRVVKTIRGYSIIDANGTESLQTASAQSVEICSYLDGTSLKKSCLRDGELTEFSYDAQLRMIASKTWVSATKALVSTISYLDGKLFSTTDAYGRRQFSLYRASDSALIRQVQELIPGGAGNITHYGQVAMLQRDLGLNPAYTVVDTELSASGDTLATIDAKGIRSESVQDSRSRTIRSVQAVALQPYYKSSSFVEIDVVNTAVSLAGSWIPNGLAATPKLIDTSVAGQISFWAVGYDGGTYTKAIKIALTPTASGGISAQVVAAKYISGNNVDFDFNNGGTGAPIASSPSGSGYTFSTIAYASSGPASTPTGIELISEQDYDLNGNVTEVRHPRSFAEGIAAKTRYTYSARNKQLSTIAADGAVNSVSYHNDGRIKETVDSIGFVTRSEWPTCCNNSTVVTDATDVAQITNNDAAGRTTHSVVKRDASTCGCSPNNPSANLTMSETTSRYDARGRVIAQTIWESPLGYVDSNNAPIADDPALGKTTRYTYYDSVIGASDLLPTLAKLPSGTFGAGFADGSATLVTNPNGERSLSINDGAGRALIQAQLPADSYEPITWSTATHDVMIAGLLESSVSDAHGFSSKSRSDAAGRTRLSIDAIGNSSFAFFDPNGNLVQSRDSLSHGQDCLYDALNRRVSCADTQEQAENKAHLSTYNASGAVITQTDTKGAVTSMVYDLMDRMVSTTERNTGVVQFAYDLKGQRTSVTDQLSKVTSYQFNPRGELVKTINADGSIDQSVFDASGRKIKVIHPGGNSAVMAYDLASRLLSRSYFAAGSGIAESIDSFTYDNASRPVTANNANAQITYAYDAIGRRISLTQTVDGIAKSVTFAYDSANRLLSRAVEGLAVESRSFTPRGQLAQVKLDNQLVADFSYDDVGREVSRTYGNGLNTSSSYSRADNLITAITVANKPELSFGYSYDSNKNVTAEQRGGLMALYSWNATFDAMDRLNSQNDGAQTRSWSLDLVGNTTTETLNGTAEARTLNDMHAPTVAGNKAYNYDSNGQMTAKPGYTLTWDARNHLIRSTDTSNPSAPTDCVYRYDAFGNRVSKGDTRYLLVDNQVIAEFTGSASKQYAYGSYIDEVLAEKGSEVSYYHRNRQYNTVALTDASGAILEQYSTDAMGRVKAFGAAATAKAAPTATTLLFTGRVWDVETGLYYFRARYFEPELGVFISRDPLGFVDGQSVYQGWFFLKSKGDHSGHVTVEFNGFIGKSHNTFSDASHGWIIAPYVPWDFYMHTDNRNAGEPGTHRIQTKFTLGDCDPGEKAPEITHNVGESSYMILAKDPPNPIIESIEYRTAKPTRANKFPSIDGACVSSGIGQLGVGYPFFKQFTPDIDMETNVSFVLSNGGKTLDLYMVINRDDFPDFEILVNGKLVQSYPAIGDSPIAVFGSTNNEKMVKYSIPVDCPCRCEGKQEPQW